MFRRLVRAAPGAYCSKNVRTLSVAPGTSCHRSASHCSQCTRWLVGGSNNDSMAVTSDVKEEETEMFHMREATSNQNVARLNLARFGGASSRDRQIDRASAAGTLKARPPQPELS